MAKMVTRSMTFHKYCSRTMSFSALSRLSIVRRVFLQPLVADWTPPGRGAVILFVPFVDIMPLLAVLNLELAVGLLIINTKGHAASMIQCDKHMIGGFGAPYTKNPPKA